MIELSVELGERRYPVLVGAGARHRLAEHVPAGAQRAAIVTQQNIPWTVDAGIEQKTFYVGDGEQAKHLGTVEDLCREMARWDLHRHDVIVAVGGGVVTDVAGFVAAVYHRGVAVVHVPTTLLGQVDAAIGGKTGVNLEEGKNLVGAFWQPSAVLCDTDPLTTLTPREYRSGLGEMAKYRFLGVPHLRDLPLDEAIAACVARKAEIVGVDERESGQRALLNYGHTLAHALETVGRYGLLHGEAVAIGLVFAARLAEQLGRIDKAGVEEHVSLVTAYGLPTHPPDDLDAGQLVAVMSRDKKADGRGLTFVLDGPSGLEVIAGIDPDLVTSVLQTPAA